MYWEEQSQPEIHKIAKNQSGNFIPWIEEEIPPCWGGIIDAHLSDGALVKPYFDYTNKWYTKIDGVLRKDFVDWSWTGCMPTKESQGKSIITWEFRDAPGFLQSLSESGGDEDWLSILPDDCEPSWMLEGGPYGCCRVYTYALDDGRYIKIGCHA